MKISEVAKMVDLPISTIRYYEKMGLITDEYILRDENNYRNYSKDIIRHLEVIKNCLSIGFSIKDIQTMISKNGMSKEEQQHLYKEKISEIESIQMQLEESKQCLNELIQNDVTCEHEFGKL